MTKEELYSMKTEAPDRDVEVLAKQRWDSLVKPIDGLGAFEEMICRIAGIQGKTSPTLSRKGLIIMCADNGVVEEGVTQTGQSVTYDVAEMMGERRSSVGRMTMHYPLDIFPYDVGINTKDTPKGVINRKIRQGTANLLKGPAMTEQECLAAIGVGLEAVRDCHSKGYDIIATGEMGIGNTTSSAALLSALTGEKPERFTGRGSGLPDAGLERKKQVIRDAVRLHRGAKAGTPVKTAEETLQVLTALGGLDIAALVGVFLGGAVCRIPIAIDGLISAVSAYTAELFLPGCRDYMIASHSGKEKGTERILTELSLTPVLQADMALGEGTGAVLLFPMLDMALSLYLDGTTFQDTDIAKYERFGK